MPNVIFFSKDHENSHAEAVTPVVFRPLPSAAV